MNLTKDEHYERDQTPKELALRLVDFIDIQPEDTCYEPMKGSGAFYDALKTKAHHVDWCEIREGRDYLANTAKYDHIVTNPAYGEKGLFWKVLWNLSTQVEKTLAVLGNQFCFTSLTPKRLKMLEGEGLFLSRVVVCNVKKWYGKFYFMIFTRNKNDAFNYLEGSF